MCSEALCREGSVGFGLDIWEVVRVGKEAPASCLQQFVDFDSCEGFLNGFYNFGFLDIGVGRLLPAEVEMAEREVCVVGPSSCDC